MTKKAYILSKLKDISEKQRNGETLKTESVLEIIDEKYNSHQNNYEKDFTKIQKQSTEKIHLLVEQNMNKKHIRAWIFRNECLIKYSKDKNIHELIDTLNNENLYNYIKSKTREIINTKSFFDDSDNKNFVPVPYGGGKQNHQSSQQSIVSFILLNNPDHFKSYYETFVGGFGSVYNSLPLLIKNGIKDIYLNDINNSLINLYRQIQKNHKQVQRHLASFEMEYLENNNKLYPTSKEEGKEWFKRLYDEFSELEIKKRMNPRRAALFMYLLHNTQGGMLSFNMATKLNSLKFNYCQNKLKQIPLMINKVEIYNKIFNLVNIKFSIKKYQIVNNKIKNDSTALVLFDPPYVKYEEVSTSKDFLSCSYNYGINDFNHRGLINKIKDSKYSFVYYNNHNPHLENYSNRENFYYHKKDVVYKNGKEGTKSVEILMFKDRTKLSVNSVNSCDFNPVEIKKVS